MNRGAPKPGLKSRGLDTDNMQKGGKTISQTSLLDPGRFAAKKEDGMKISLYCKLVYSASYFLHSPLLF